MSSSKPDQVFPPGFERDTKALLMLREYGVISRFEVRKNLDRLGVELTPEPDLAPPALKTAEPRGSSVELVWDEAIASSPTDETEE
jgi:hypothetical protein